MEIVLGYIESLMYWRAHRVANQPTFMSRRTPLSAEDARGNAHTRVNLCGKLVHAEASAYTNIPPISFAEQKLIPTAEIKNYMLSRLSCFAPQDNTTNRLQYMDDYTIASMLEHNMYNLATCEHMRAAEVSAEKITTHATHATPTRATRATPTRATRATRASAAKIISNDDSVWSQKSYLIEHLHGVRLSPHVTASAPLNIFVPREQRGLSQKDKRLTYINTPLPRGMIYQLVITSHEKKRFGLPPTLKLYIISPELAVLFAAQKLQTLCLGNVCPSTSCYMHTRGKQLFVHNVISLVNEVCGTYGRDPLTASVMSYGLRPLTSVQKIRRCATAMKGVHGCKSLLAALDYCNDNLASAFEGAVASALMLPTKFGGINFPPLEINQTRSLAASSALTPHHQSITPDLSSKEHRLIIECNGLAFHKSNEAIKEDHRRLRDYVTHSERHIPLTMSDIKNSFVLSKTLEEIVAACHDTLGVDKSAYLRKVIHNAKLRPARQIMLDVQLF